MHKWNFMHIYSSWGFLENPFDTRSLPAQDIGAELLVGRNDEKDKLKLKLYNPPKIPTLEGMNGVGKTSIVNVAAYECYENFLHDPDKPLLIRCRRIFQLTPAVSRPEFIRNVLLEVAQTLIDYSNQIEGSRLSTIVNARALQAWLNAPQVKGIQTTLGPIGGGVSTETNTSDGFAMSGFPNAIRVILEELFPKPSSGGVICVIDNLELLQTSESARDLLEALRDELFNMQGLRWVLCGALGIILGVASSPRLDGMMFDPIEVKSIPPEVTGEIFESRLKAYRNNDSVYMPLLVEDFESLYRILGGNIRALLGHSDMYCQHIVETNAKPETNEEKSTAFTQWLDKKSSSFHEAAKGTVAKTAWRAFLQAADDEGVFSPSDYEKFGFTSSQAFRPHVKDLEDAGLVVSTKEEGDRRRKTIQITPRGWLVNYHVRKSGEVAH